MWLSSFRPNCWPWTSTERRPACLPARRRAALRPALQALDDHRLPAAHARFRRRGIVSAMLTAAVNLVWTTGIASALIAPVVGLMWARSHTEAPAPQEPPGSGIVERSEVIAIWMPRDLRDLALHKARPPAALAPTALKAYLERSGWKDAWYALTCRGHQVNGRFAEATQIRRLSEAADHLHELEAVMATAAGTPPRTDDPDFSHARIEVIPDAVQGVDPRVAIARLLVEPVVRKRSAQPRGVDSTQPIE